MMLTRRATELEEFILNAREPVLQLLCFCEQREQAKPSDVDPWAESTETTLLTLIESV